MPNCAKCGKKLKGSRDRSTHVRDKSLRSPVTCAACNTAFINAKIEEANAKLQDETAANPLYQKMMPRRTE